MPPFRDHRRQEFGSRQESARVGLQADPIIGNGDAINTSPSGLEEYATRHNKKLDDRARRLDRQRGKTGLSECPPALQIRDTYGNEHSCRRAGNSQNGEALHSDNRSLQILDHSQWRRWQTASVDHTVSPVRSARKPGMACGPTRGPDTLHPERPKLSLTG